MGECRTTKFVTCHFPTYPSLYHLGLPKFVCLRANSPPNLHLSKQNKVGRTNVAALQSKFSCTYNVGAVSIVSLFQCLDGFNVTRMCSPLWDRSRQLEGWRRDIFTELKFFLSFIVSSTLTINNNLNCKWENLNPLQLWCWCCVWILFNSQIF